MAHTHYFGCSGPSLRFAIALTAGLCFIAFGYGQGDIGGLMIMPSFAVNIPTFYIPKGAAVSSLATKSIDMGAIIGTWNLGCFVGAAGLVFFGDRLGRRGSAVAGCALEIVGKIIQCTTFGTGQYVAGRFIAGIGNGMIASTIPAWQAETLKTHRRGTMLLVSFGTCITLGTAIAYWFVYAFSFTEPNTASWRVPIALSMLFILPAFLLLCFLPESPRWLILQARETEAIRVLSALNELPEDSEDIRREILQIKYAVKHMASAPISDVFKNNDYRFLHRTLLAILLQVMQQFTGVNLFFQYLGAMFQNQLGYKTELSLLLAGCCSTEFFLASLVAVVGIDRFWTRRTLTMFGASGMSVCMIILSAMNYIAIKEGITAGFYVMTAFLFLYCTFFSIGWQGMSWMWSVEIIPLSIRGPANALATATNWLANFVVVLVTPPLFNNTTYRTYIVWAVTNFLIVPTIYFLFPETGGRSLEEVDMVFKNANARKNPWLAVVQAAREEPRWYDKKGDPTDSWGGSSGASDKGDLEKGSSSGGYPPTASNGSPEDQDPTWRRRETGVSLDGEGEEDDGVAPAPDVRRTGSEARTLSKG